MKPRLLSLCLAVALAAAAVSGCTPAPAPSPSPTGFATEAEAFAAAEETYRAYVDALNEVDLSDPETFEAVYAWTTGDANAGARKSFSQMHADGWVVSGESTVARIAPVEASIEDRMVAIVACLDVSEVGLAAPDGTSVVSPDRPATQIVRVNTIGSATSPTGLLIEKLDGFDEAACAGL